MSGDELDRALHDYVDGRLSESGRREFEKRMEGDPELRRRVESYRSIGTALRETEIELPPGFYARARERFESSRSVAPRWRRLITWEAAGLAAAAMLLVAILLPPTWERRGADGMPQAPAMSTKPSAPAAPESTLSATQGKEADEIPGAKNRVQPGPRAEEQARRTDDDSAVMAKSPESAPLEEFAPVPDDRAFADAADHAEVRSFDETAAVGPEPARPAKSVGGRASGEAEKNEPLAARLQSVGKVQAETEVAQSLDAMEEREVSQDDHARLRIHGESYAVFWGQPLPEGLFDRAVARRLKFNGEPSERSFVVIEDEEAWARLGEGESSVGGAFEYAGGFQTHRLVLIGPHPEPITCYRLNWHLEAGAIVIGVAPPDSAGIPSPTGCAVWVPAVDEPVVLRLVDH